MDAKRLLKTQIDVLSTLKAFEPMDVAYFLYDDINIETKRFSNRYHRLKNQGIITGDYSFYHQEYPKGTVVVRRT